ncbi:MAG: hypothetical protein RR800_00505 [Comamonas sp.]
MELGSVAQGKLRTLQRAGWIIGGYALQQHTDALWPMRSVLTTDGYFGMLPDQNRPEAAAAETCEISQTAKLRKAMRLLHEVSAEFLVDGHDLEFEDGDHPLVDRVRVFLVGAPTPDANGYPPLPKGDHASAYVSDAQVFSASEMRIYVDADRAMRASSISADDRRDLVAGAGLLAGHGHKGSSAALLRLLAATDVPASGAVALSDYLKNCDQHSIVPDVGGAFAFAFAAGFNLATPQAAPAALAVPDDRAAFERELIDNHHYVPSDFSFKDGFYGGDDDYIQFGWDVWKACAALAATPAATNDCPTEADPANETVVTLADMEEWHSTATPAAAGPVVLPEPAEFQCRTKPEWDAKAMWTDWEKCKPESAADYERVPVLHNWMYEVRRLYTEQQLRATLLAGVSAPAAQAITLLAGDHSGMKVDYRGLFKQVQRAIKRSDPGYAEMLRQLEGHLQELGQRWYAGDTNVVDEILQLYCIERDARKTVRQDAAAPQAQADARDARIYTYSQQPTDNVIAWRFGEACSKARSGGDYIDYGLSLLQNLQEKGYGITAIAAQAAQQGGDKQ